MKDLLRYYFNDDIVEVEKLGAIKKRRILTCAIFPFLYTFDYLCVNCDYLLISPLFSIYILTPIYVPYYVIHLGFKEREVLILHSNHSKIYKGITFQLHEYAINF